MKRFGVVALMAVASLAFSAIGASTASAKCYQIDEPKDGFYEDPACKNLFSPAEHEYEEAEPVTKIRPGLWCAKVTVHFKTGRYDDSKCTEKLEKEPKGEYVLILVPEGCGGGALGPHRATNDNLDRRRANPADASTAARASAALFVDRFSPGEHSALKVFATLLL